MKTINYLFSLKNFIHNLSNYHFLKQQGRDPHLAPHMNSPELWWAGWRFAPSKKKTKENISALLWREVPGEAEVRADSPWVASDWACRRDLPDSSRSAAGAPHRLSAALWSPCKKRPCPCSAASCGSRTGRLLSAAAPGGSSAGCGRWCSVVEPRPVQPELPLWETNGDTTFRCVGRREVGPSVSTLAFFKPFYDLHFFFNLISSHPCRFPENSVLTLLLQLQKHETEALMDLQLV